MTAFGIILLIIVAVLLLKFGFVILKLIIGFLFDNILWVLLVILIIGLLFC